MYIHLSPFSYGRVRIVLEMELAYLFLAILFGLASEWRAVPSSVTSCNPKFLKMNFELKNKSLSPKVKLE